MKKVKILSLMMFVLFAATNLNAQIKTVIGKVYAFKDTPINNIRVYSKKTKRAVYTNELGIYKIETKAKDKLVFEGEGFQKSVKMVEQGEQINVKLIFIEGAENEKIAIGAGHLTEETLTYSVSNFLEYNNDFSVYRDIWQLLQGKFPGVKVVTDVNGETKVVIRNPIHMGAVTDDKALYMVDGVIWQDISILRPQDIKSINVVKDGATFGFRGANGVVLITTVDNHQKSDN
ncbi:MAG: TonB-dependent SusC/RagA subfamily outer membrane receptor [Roseivirga sp.]|jgi:TonB-dependent SusC/RagA subfamily outer membrane receptor